MTYESDKNDMAREFVIERAQTCIGKLKKQVSGVCPEHANISEGLALSLEMQVPMFQKCSKETSAESVSTLSWGKLKLTGKEVIEMAIRAALLLGILWIIFGGAISKAADDPAVQIRQTESGSTVFLVDILAIDSAKLKTMPWYEKPVGVAKQLGNSTVQNVKDNPWWWIASAAGAAVASGAADSVIDSVSDMFSGGGGSGGPSQPKQPREPQPAAITVQGNGNTVETWYDVPGGVHINGEDNTVILNNSGE